MQTNLFYKSPSSGDQNWEKSFREGRNLKGRGRYQRGKGENNFTGSNVVKLLNKSIAIFVIKLVIQKNVAIF